MRPLMPPSPFAQCLMLRDSVHALILGLLHGFIQLQLISEGWSEQVAPSGSGDRTIAIAIGYHGNDRSGKEGGVLKPCPLYAT